MSYRNTGKESNKQHPESILAQKFVRQMLQSAQENLRRDGSLAPVLFIRPHNEELGIIPLDLPGTTEEKYAYFAALGFALLSAGKQLQEALFLSETWYVSSKEDPKLDEEVRPSQHPGRREAISIVGRDEMRSRFTFVVQVFHHDSRNRLVFDAREVEEYNVGVSAGMEPVGLLDALFPQWN